MDISYILLILFAALFVFLFICMGYLFLYKRHINKVLIEPEKKHIKMVPPYKVLLVLIIVFAIVAASFAATIISNVKRLSTVNDIENDVRSVQNISSDWNMEIAMNDRIAAVIAYDDQRSEHIFSIYISNSKTRTDYVFRYGGKATSIERSIRVFKFEGSTAFISMNTLHISAIECHDGERYEVDPNAPFVLVIPNGGFDIYDDNGNLIDLTQDWWYELTEPKGTD